MSRFRSRLTRQQSHFAEIRGRRKLRQMLPFVRFLGAATPDGHGAVRQNEQRVGNFALARNDVTGKIRGIDKLRRQGETLAFGQRWKTGKALLSSCMMTQYTAVV